MQEAIAPTPERLRHARAYLPPEHSQAVKRPYTRVLDEFERLLEIGKLDVEQFQAARKLQKHWNGSFGVDVRDGEGFSDGDYEFASVRHGSEIAHAKRVLGGRMMWPALEMLLKGEGIEHVGRKLHGYQCAKQARAFGLGTIQCALDVLVLHWGLAQRHRPPSR